jgi:L,D-peptidoglycan transpeptidase YkuD (ErfK/YbiS/YcfS/YnhG family)
MWAMSESTALRALRGAAVVVVLSALTACGVIADVERSETATAGTAEGPFTTPELAGPGPLSGPATATSAAVRVDPPPQSSCEAIARRVSNDHPAADHLVLVVTDAWDDTTAVLRMAERSGSSWSCGAGYTARIGNAGFRPLAERRSGDGTTPAGVFPLATMTAWDGERFSFFGNDPDPGVTAGNYRRVRAGDCFGATPHTPGYGHLRYDTSCPGPDDEYLPRYVQAYTNAALIGANMEPDVSGDEPGEIPYAAAIFLHRHVYDQGGATLPTSGCVSLAQPDLTAVLVDLRPDSLFVMGPTSWLLGER